MLQDRADGFALIFCLLFVAVGSLWISEIGIQNDEALFSAGIYPPFGIAPKLMVMTYVGTLKSYVYKPIFKLWAPSAASTRIPALLLGALTIWLFYLLLKRTLGRRAAVVGTCLLATDTTFLLTTRWDWGPVVLQHLCLVGGMVSILGFVSFFRLRYLALGFFLFGLGVWDKTIFLWSLAGLGVATLIVFPKRLFALVNLKTSGVASGAFLLGSAPFLYYNLRFNWITFRQNAAWSSDILGYKAGLLQATLEGSALFGGVPRDEWDGPIREPDDAAKRALVSVSHFVGSPRRNLQVALLLLTLALLPLVWRTPARTAFLFAFVYLVITWLQMAFTKDAGTGVHHPILMWPMPQLGIAGILAESSRRVRRIGTPLLAGVMALVAGSNLAVTSTYYANMLRNGGNVAWSDAIFPASEALPSLRPSYVCILDWGFFETIRMLHKGRVPVCVTGNPERDPTAVRRQLADPNMVFIAHTKGLEFNAGEAERFVEFAKSEGYSKSDQRVFYDYNGRPIIEIFKLFRSQR